MIQNPEQIKIHDNIFDKKWVDDLAFYLSTNVSWYADNIAGRQSWPYGQIGQHRIMGRMLYKYNNWKDIVLYKREKFLELTEAFEHLAPNIELKEIFANLQFKGMDGSFHKDGDDNYKVFILMLTCVDMNNDYPGGEFIVKDGEIEPFKQGRIIEFYGNVLHKAMAFNQPYVPRFSMKFGGYEKS